MTISFEIFDLTQKESINRVGWFFRYEAEKRSPIKGVLEMPELFNEERWGQCSEAIVAEYRSEIVGIVTLAHRGINNFGSPMVDTLYVQKVHCRKGLGTSLFKQGIRRLISVTGESEIFCDVSSSVVARIVERLPEELRCHLIIRESFRNRDLAEEFEDLERDCPG